MLKYKQNFDETKKRLDAFWKMEVTDRPCVYIDAPKKGATRKHHNVNSVSLLKCQSTKELELLLDRFDEYARNTAYLGEAVPFMSMDFGPDSFAAFLGAKIYPSDSVITTWVEPIVDRWSDFSPKLDKSENSTFNKYLSFLKYCTDYSEGKFLIGMLDMHSNLDAMSALRSPQNLCFDFMDYPDEVRKALTEVRKIYFSVYEEMFKAGKMRERGSIGWGPIYSSGRSQTAECDFSCLISPNQGVDTFIEALREEASNVDNCIYHLDGKDALCHLDNLLDIKEIDVIQWVPGDGQPRTIEWMDLLKKIQSRGKGLWIYDWSIEEIKTHFKELKPEGLFFQVYCGSEDEGEELLEYLTKNF